MYSSDGHAHAHGVVCLNQLKYEKKDQHVAYNEEKNPYSMISAQLISQIYFW